MSGGRTVVKSALLAMLILAPSAQSRALDLTGGQAIEMLAREKTLVEGCAAILKSFAGDDLMARVQGQRLYARAKAEADGLIAWLITGLGDQRSPAAVPELQTSMALVPAKRRAFCGHVVDTVWPLPDAGRTADGIDPLAVGAGSRDSLVEAGVAVWQAYRDADQARRTAITTQLERARWLTYDEVPKA